VSLFLSGLGVVFSIGFLGLTVAWAFLVLRVRERADEAIAGPGAPSSRDTLLRQRAHLVTDAERVGLVAGAVPVLALIGTVLGFFFALGKTSHVGLGATDPLAILKVMLDSGMDTALATTVAGQALYFLMILGHGAFVTGRFERADLLLEERIQLSRADVP
jgi:hypothetical protein